jgi:hypothetical protein
MADTNLQRGQRTRTALWWIVVLMAILAVLVLVSI